MSLLRKILIASAMMMPAALMTGTAASADPGRFMEMNTVVKAPIGHKQFCRDYAWACPKERYEPVVVRLDEARWQELIDINTEVNRRVRPMTDEDLFGEAERWTYPVEGYGDCEEYVLEKQRVLVEAGWPRSALLITVAKDVKNSGHAVLTVRTDHGDVILDNQIEAVLPWYSTPYRYIKRQSASSTVVWTGISDTRVTTVSSVSR
ncbi:transglutaminase-like cysteine peptidase [Roseibium marinum]|uniref:Putative transglutaminase-like cysteine proteinase n=1 Tax=Roseibium marinum TaxID=281252 RepID=A0A2S3UVC4_9HYPH|nr:transglutaminase-like cysteine peptidase [Roseibium marinum]POF31636.1 putative transglutaminase-like cysteine proteinase [Roseibium marinum]